MDQVFGRGELFRRHMGNLDLIVHMHNNVEVTLLPVERPLLQQQLEQIDQLLAQGIGGETHKIAIQSSKTGAGAKGGGGGSGAGGKGPKKKNGQNNPSVKKGAGKNASGGKRTASKRDQQAGVGRLCGCTVSTHVKSKFRVLG